MLKSFCGYIIIMLVFLDDMQFGFSVCTEMIKQLILSTMLANTVCVCVYFEDMDMLPSCVKFHLAQSTRKFHITYYHLIRAL